MDGFPVTINSPRQQSAVIKWILDHIVSFIAGTLLGLNADTAYEVGTVLGKVTLGAQTVGAATAMAGNSAGNGTFNAPTGTAGLLAGDWLVNFEDATHFTVNDPKGVEQGHGVAATPYAGAGPHFTFTAGGSAQVAGDTFKINVGYAAGSGKLVQLDPAATDGSQNFAGILADRTFIPASTDVDAQVLARDAAVLTSALIWKDGTTDDQKAAVIAQMETVRIIQKSDG